jgi:hypothetical protein
LRTCHANRIRSQGSSHKLSSCHTFPPVRSPSGSVHPVSFHSVACHTGSISSHFSVPFVALRQDTLQILFCTIFHTIHHSPLRLATSTYFIAIHSITLASSQPKGHCSSTLAKVIQLCFLRISLHTFLPIFSLQRSSLCLPIFLCISIYLSCTSTAFDHIFLCAMYITSLTSMTTYAQHKNIQFDMKIFFFLIANITLL